jgi:hypothetical protein
MKKMSFLLGLGAGFLLGSRAGPGPYEQVEARIRSVGSRPEVQDTMDTVKGAVQERVEDVADRVAEQVPSSHKGSAPSSDG